MKRIFLSGVILIVTSLFAGCGQKITTEEAEARIAQLRERGVPRSEMTKISMYLNHMKTAQSIGNSREHRQYQDSLYNALNEFEDRMEILLEESALVIDSLRVAVAEKKKPLKEMHLEKAKELLGDIDSLIEIPMPLAARSRLTQFKQQLDTLLEMQNLADSLRRHVVGAWVMEQESPDPRFDVVKRQEIHFRPDGSLYIMKRSRGRTSETTREDWEFQSEGTWKLRGDMAFKFIERDKRVRYNFRYLDQETNRWITETQPPYDSTITDGSMDEFITYETLARDYKRFPLR
ncbi:hypothetical protein CHISP_2068 [Chitinispirillum alkaliphilum]|nr:hypothetical protein CHISP_2068 [Chitinispirillum alkaliphilum]